MSKVIKWKANDLPKSDVDGCIEVLKQEEIQKAKVFHESFDQYTETPLVDLSKLAEHIGVGGIYLKDESYRFGLNAFKVLGGSYAMAQYMAEKLGKDISELGYENLTSDETKEELGEMLFVTATDGNHGRGVAWTANQLGQRSVVYMPKGSSQIRVENIRKENSTVSVEDMNYDDCVRLAAEYAEENNGIVIQDTAWEGYEDIPTWIMQGYGTMALEAIEQLRDKGIDKPTHIFIQAGVGSLAAGVQGVFKSIYGEDSPITTIVEADIADCLYKSVVAGDGNAVAVGGDLQTIMAGLACGEANTIGWEILKNHSSVFVSCPDWVAADGMRILGNPLKEDEHVISGESGAVTTGLLVEIMKNDEYKDLREKLELNKDSKVLVFSTEGDTDPEVYRNIVWCGECTKN